MKKLEDKEETSFHLEAPKQHIRLQVNFRSLEWKKIIHRKFLEAVQLANFGINHILQLSILEARQTYMVVRLSVVYFIMKACSAVQEQVFKLRRHNEK